MKKQSIAFYFWLAHVTIRSAQIDHVIFSRFSPIFPGRLSNMAAYQVKVYYGPDFQKCGTFFTSSTDDFSYYRFFEGE